MNSTFVGTSNRFVMSQNDGFSLLETLVSLSICAVALGSVIGVSVHLVERAELDATSLSLVNQMRFAQTLGVTSSKAGILWLDTFDTRYRLIHGTTQVASFSFPRGINYTDGYLQLENPRVSYDNLGDAQVAGEIRLTDGWDEEDINVYMGTGLQVAGWLKK